ncbi:hypothetical protein [Marinobacter sp. DY40_1A1]|uniref:hypothetical protein n=1 Tax=Marinobacter sp. DY40_1A1 TaxID=2583229 RepID=UPI001903C483|nr:hypothetical protein [Marinobacter sp. DY40_1A1]MBK1885435.1 hypothetical protein [Marinobacter sp. DY40_1A1]
MIKCICKDEMPHGIYEVPIEPDKPFQRQDVRKLWFFLLREGVRPTLEKVFARIRQQKRALHQTVAVRVGYCNGISFDGGQNFYFSDLPQSHWASPFSYDILAQSDEEKGCSKNPVVNALYVLGFGNYAQTYTKLLHEKLRGRYLLDYNHSILNDYADKFDFFGNNIKTLLPVWAIDTNPVAVVASYHSDHARQAYRLFKSNPEGFIFIEKPPLVDISELDLFREMYSNNARINIGFNRRFSPLARRLRNELSESAPKFINISVNEVKINPSHWYFWPNQGTRITGNACHWIDMCQWFVNTKPTHLNLLSSCADKDDCVLAISYQDGSLASIFLSDKGNSLRGVQESIKVKQDGQTFVLNDMTELFTLKKSGASKRIIRLKRDKGHRRMYDNFLNDVQKGRISNQYPLEDLEFVSRVMAEFSDMLERNVKTRKLEWD